MERSEYKLFGRTYPAFGGVNSPRQRRGSLKNGGNLK